VLIGFWSGKLEETHVERIATREKKVYGSNLVWTVHDEIWWEIKSKGEKNGLSWTYLIGGAN